MHIANPIVLKTQGDLEGARRGYTLRSETLRGDRNSPMRRVTNISCTKDYAVKELHMQWKHSR